MFPVTLSVPLQLACKSLAYYLLKIGSGHNAFVLEMKVRDAASLNQTRSKDP